MFLALNVSEYNDTKMTFTRDKSCYGTYFKFVKIEVHVQYSSTVYACIDAAAFKLPKKKDKMYHHILQITEEKIPKQS